MEFNEYLPIFLQVVLAVGMGLGILIASSLFGQRAKSSPIKDSPYESGAVLRDKAHKNISIKFYLVALLFLIFDIEVVFMIPFAFIYTDFIANNISIVLPVLFFIAVMIVGIIYEVKKNSLDWNVPKTNID